MQEIRLVLRSFASICLLLCLLGVLRPVQALEQVALQLKWTHAFQFAGFYAADAKGYYREAGQLEGMRPFQLQP